MNTDLLKPRTQVFIHEANGRLKLNEIKILIKMREIKLEDYFKFTNVWRKPVPRIFRFFTKHYSNFCYAESHFAELLIVILLNVVMPSVIELMAIP